MRAVYVGRVGALAVALGVGTAILGFSAGAAADTGSTPGSAGDESTQSDASRATAKTRAGNRRNPPESRPSDTPTVTAGRRSGGLRPGLAVTNGRNAGAVPVVPQSPADLIGALLTPGGMTALVQDTMTSLIGTLLSGVSIDDLMSEAVPTLEITATQAADVTPVEEAPVLTAQPDALSVASGASLDALGGGSGGGDPLAAPLAWAAMAVTQKESEADAATVAPAATVTTGEPVDSAAPATKYEDFLPLPATYFGDATRTELFTYRPTIVNNIAQSFATAFDLGQIATADKCAKDKGCPSPLTVSSAVGMYGFNVLYALMGAVPQKDVAKAVQQLASQPVILDFIASTVAARISANYTDVPPAVANLVGTAVRTFVLSSFGSASGPAKTANYVAYQFVPFLRALNLPTGAIEAPKWLKSLEGDPETANAAILERFNKDQQKTGQKALFDFFSNGDVQGYLGNAFASSIKVLLVPTMADYLGGNVAAQILGEDNPNTATLGTTIGNAISGLFSSIGGIVATQAGKAFGTTFLNSPNIPTYLANATVNGYITFLTPKGTKPDLQFEQGPLRPLIAPAAGTAVTWFVNSLFTAPNLQPVSAGLDQFITTLIPGMLSNPGVQQKLGDEVAGKIDNPVIAAAVSGAVEKMVADPLVQTTLAASVNALGKSILNSPAAVSALATAAGQWVTAFVDKTLTKEVQKQIIDTLRQTPAIYTAVGQSVASGVTDLFGNTEVLTAVNNAVVSSVTTLLSDPAAQDAIGTSVATDVAKLFKDAALGQAVGAQAGAAVVRLLGNPDIRSALVSLVDTMFSDFFRTDGVLAAFAKAAGEIAAADVAMDTDAAKAAQAAFKTNTDVQQAVASAVGGAVRTALTDPTVLAALDHAAGAFVDGLLGDSSVQARLSSAVAAEVSKALGDGKLGQAVGAQAGVAVADLLSQQSVRTAVAGLVDTELGEFFASDGVVNAFAIAADTYALDILSGNGTNAATDARKSLQDSAAVQDAVGTIVTKSVSELLNDSALWTAIDASAARLVSATLADPEVQEGVSERVYLAVWKALNGTKLAVAVADQVSSAVVDLMKNPTISAGLVGVVDTVLSDFFRTDGVITAFSTAAGQLATAAVAGTFPDVEKQVQAELRANTAVQQGVNNAVGDAVTTLLTDQNLVSALNDRLASLMSDVLGDPAVQDGLREDVADSVSDLLGGGALGDSVGAQVGTAVVEIVTNPIVKDALEGLVDTELGDFFRAPGVVAAFAAAADTFALEAFTGTSANDAAKDAIDQLRTAAAIDTAVQGIVTTTVAELLGNADVWAAVDGTVSFLVRDLLADTDVQNAVSDKVYLAVWNAFNQTFLGVAVGDRVAAAVVDLMKNPAVSLALVGLVDTVSADFFGYDGVATAFANAAGELAAAAVEGPAQFKAALSAVQKELRQNPNVDQAIGVAVGDAVEALLTDPEALAAVDDTAAALVNVLLTDTTVQAELNAEVAGAVSKFLGGGDLGDSVGAEVGITVVNFLSDANVRQALVGLFDNELGDFFNSPGVVASFVEAADTFAVSVVTGESVKTASSEAITWLRANAAIDDAVQGIVSDGVANVLGNANVIAVFDKDLGTLLTDLVPDAGQIVSLLVTRSLSPDLIAAPVGQAIGDAVQQLLTVPGFGPGVLTIITSIVPDFLRQFGVPTAIGGVAGQYAASVLAGMDPKEAEKQAVADLEASPTIDSAAKETIADSLILADLNLLSNPTIQQALGATVATLITTLAAEPVIQALFAAPLAELLSNTEVVDQVAAAVGSAVTQFLGYPGFNAAFLGAVNQYADARIDGTDEKTAQEDAVRSLRSAPVVVSAVNSVIPATVNSLLAYPDVLAALGLYADEETIASLQKSWFNIRLLDPTIGQVVNGTVASLLTRQAGVILADNLAVSVVLGMPWQDWRAFTAQEIIADPFLQIAVGMSIGQGVGSLLGDNVVADLVGVAVGVPAVLAVSIGAGIAGILQWLFGKTQYGVNPAASTSQTSTGGKHRLREDLYVTNTVVLSPVPAAS